MKIGEKLAHFRRLSNMTQTAVEWETKIPQTTISSWERDKSEPSFSELMQLLDCFGISIETFMSDKEVKKNKLADQG